MTGKGNLGAQPPGVGRAAQECAWQEVRAMAGVAGAGWWVEERPKRRGKVTGLLRGGPVGQGVWGPLPLGAGD